LPIDIDKVVGAELVAPSYTWRPEDVILYNLGVGAGNPPSSPDELKYTYEGAGLKAVPAFGTIPPFGAMMGVGSVEGLDIDLAQILHGDQTLTVHDPIPTSGTVHQDGRVIDVFDKGKGALLVIEVVSTLEKTGEPLFTNRSGVYVRGEGGFGGESGPPASNQSPGRPPDHLVESPTLPQQALLYRMASGDKNPLHADPGFAGFAGFERPILHGLCTYGVVLKAVVETVLGGEPERVGTYQARFTGHVFPGETLVTSIWEEADRCVVAAATKERGTAVLGNAAVFTR
jgi:acyl dehydratase